MRIEVRDVSEREMRILLGAAAWSAYKAQVDAALQEKFGINVEWVSATFYANRAATSDGALDTWNVVTHSHKFPDELKSGYCAIMHWSGIAPDAI